MNECRNECCKFPRASRFIFADSNSFDRNLYSFPFQMKHSKLPLSFFLVIPLIFGTCISASTGAQSFRRDGNHNTVNFAHFVINPSHRLNGAVLVGFMVLSPTECAYHCLNNQDCYSVNFATTSLDGRHSCELLNTDMFINSDDLVSHAGFDHYNINVRVKRFCFLLFCSVLCLLLFLK